MAKSTLTDADILAQIPAARAHEQSARKHGMRSTSARYDRATERVMLELTNGFLLGIPVHAIPALRSATSTQRAAAKVDVSGSVLRWDALDIDVSIPALILSVVDVPEKRRHLASLVGQTTSPKKATASRKNGAKGGRPKKKNIVAQVKKTARKVAATNAAHRPNKISRTEMRGFLKAIDTTVTRDEDRL